MLASSKLKNQRGGALARTACQVQKSNMEEKQTGQIKTSARVWRDRLKTRQNTLAYMNKITVLLADDHAFVRESCRMMLELESDIEVVGEAQDGRQAVELAKKLHPDVALMDIAMPSLNGLEATRQIHNAIPDTKVLMLSGHSDDAYVQTATESGAAGFILKEDSTQNVCRAIREVHQGKTFFSPDIVRHFDRRKLPLRGCAGGRNPKRAQLTPRELEVLQLVAEGNANKETAAELGIGLKTAEKHREHIEKKLDIHDTAGLTRYAISAGILANSVPLTTAWRLK